MFAPSRRRLLALVMLTHALYSGTLILDKTQMLGGQPMEQNVLEALKEIISRFAPKRSGDLVLTTDTLLDDEIGIDSPRMIDILLDIEDRFKITIEDRQFQEVRTFGDLVRLVSGVINVSS
jgi:acyl carrier protein